MLRFSLLLAAATASAVSVGHAQQRGQSRDDLLDALTRHIQICAEITDTQQRLSCYDRLQTQVGGVTPQQPAVTPTPLQAQQPQPQFQPQPLPEPTTGTSVSSAPLTPTPLTPTPLTPTPLTPPPLSVPGGGTATLPQAPGGGTRDPDAAFDPRTATAPQPGQAGPRPQTTMRRTGPRAIPNYSTQQPLVTLGAANLTYGPTRYWQVTVTLTSTTPRAVTAQAECTFMNGGRPVGTDYLGPVTIQPGEQITAELIGPSTTTYVDSSNCKLLSP
ncbi:MAG: hypothetical protein U1E60_01295 [Reyranellaceae bacterium]